MRPFAGTQVADPPLTTGKSSAVRISFDVMFSPAVQNDEAGAPWSAGFPLPRYPPKGGDNIAQSYTPAPAKAALTIAFASSWIRVRWSAPRKLSE